MNDHNEIQLDDDDTPTKGQKWVELCGWWRHVTEVIYDPNGRTIVVYDASRGNGIFQCRCSLKAWCFWAKSNRAKVVS